MSAAVLSNPLVMRVCDSNVSSADLEAAAAHPAALVELADPAETVEKELPQRRASRLPGEPVVAVAVAVQVVPVVGLWAALLLEQHR